MNKLQSLQCEMLEKLICLLEENNIDYWLAYGSVLGAVRHNGFIPWDDDIDVYINGKDYPKLRILFKEGPIGNLRLDDAFLCGDYPYTFPKVVDCRTCLIEKRFEKCKYMGGVYIDVFPLYSVRNSKLLRSIGYFTKYCKYAIVESHYYDKSEASLLRKMIIMILKLFSKDKAQAHLFARYCKGFTQSDKYLSEPLQFNDKNLHKKEHFDGFKLHKFENLEVRIPGNPHDYLVEQYGEYMKLPPADKRVSCHSFVYVEFPDGSVLKENEEKCNSD